MITRMPSYGKNTYEKAFNQAKKEGGPVRFEDDLICNICGEPWTAKGVWQGDMSGTEIRRFLDGKGCPCCPKKE